MQKMIQGILSSIEKTPILLDPRNKELGARLIINLRKTLSIFKKT